MSESLASERSETRTVEERVLDELVLDYFQRASGAAVSHRLTDFELALNRVRDFIAIALGIIERSSLEFGPPGSRPQWPPLSTSVDAAYRLTESVLRLHGWSGYANELASLYYWMIQRGSSARCGELFSAGLDGLGYLLESALRLQDRRSSATIAHKSWSLVANLFGFMRGQDMLALFEEENARPYLSAISDRFESDIGFTVENHAPDALAAVIVGYQSFLNSLDAGARAIEFDPRIETVEETPMRELLRDLETSGLESMLALGGRIEQLALLGALSSGRRYLTPIAERIPDVETLSRALTGSLTHLHDHHWERWETENAAQLEVRAVSPEQFPLLFFASRLLELADATSTPQLSRSAEQVRNWMDDNRDRLSELAQLGLVRVEDFGQSWLRAMQMLDRSTEQYGAQLQADIAARPLDVERIEEFKEKLREDRRRSSTVDKVFEWLGSRAIVPAGDPKFGFNILVRKEPFTADPTWAPLPTWELATALEGRLLADLVAALDGALDVEARPTTAGNEVLTVIAQMNTLGSPELGLILLQGDWLDATVDLDVHPPDGWVPDYSMGEDERGVFQLGRYRGWPVLRVEGLEKLAYVIDVKRFGTLLRGGSADVGADLEIEVEAISEARARTILEARAGADPEDPEAALALRRQVNVRVWEQASFSVLDSAAALRVRLAAPRREE